MSMYKQNFGLSTLYILFGSLLLILSAGQWMMQLIAALLALCLINHGLSLRGMPPLNILVVRWLDRTRYY